MEDRCSHVATIRARPSMYVPEPRDGSGVLHMLWELVRNAVDEHLAGHASTIEVRIEDDGWFSVEDDGRGISEEIALRATTEFHGGPTFDEHPRYLRAGLHVGLVVVSALSETMEIETRSGGCARRARIERGVVVEGFHEVGSTDRTGTRVRFRPDRTIFARTSIDLGVVGERIDELAAFLPALEIVLAAPTRRDRAPRGLAAYVDARVPSHVRIHPSTLVHTWSERELRVDVAAVVVDRPFGFLRTFCNAEPTPEGGTHRTGFLRAFASLGAGPRAPEQIAAVVGVMCLDPEYSGPTSGRLATLGMRSHVERESRLMLRRFADGHPDVIRALARTR